MGKFQGLAGACEAILTSMANYQGNNYAFTLGPENGALNFIASKANLQSANAKQVDLQSQTGKVKRARVVYKQRGSDSNILTGQAAKDANLCDTPVTVEQEEAFIDIDRRTATRVLKFSNDDLNQICENPDMYMETWFLEELRTARQAMDKELLALWESASGPILGHTGDVAAGTDKSLKLLSINGTTSERTPLYSQFNQIKLDYRKMQLRGIPHLIGQGILDEYFDLSGYACCNSTTPYAEAVRQSANTAYFYDQNADEIMGDNEFLVIAPGSSIFIKYNENASLNINTPLVKHTLLPDPEVNGLVWDMDFKWDECTKSYLWFASVWWDIFNTFQDDSFASGDPLRGMNGIFKYKATAS